MFTGIVEELGEVVALEHGTDSARLRVRGPLAASDASHGDSIAVNGVCLTVVDVRDGAFTADVMAETLDRSALASLAPGDPVNLERALRADARLGGHVVQGHVDGVGQVLARTPGERWEVVRVGLPEPLRPYVVEKGSIAVDGTSLTVSAVLDDAFEVSLIPATLAATTLGRRAVGDLVNLEVDVLAKYVERQVAARLAALTGGAS
jgi:riboflavin synthase